MTLVEFIAPIKGSTNKKKVLAALYYMEEYLNQTPIRAQEIKAALVGARAPNARTMNVSDVLARCGHFVNSPGSDGVRRVWELTVAGRAEVQRMLDLDLPSRSGEPDVRTLEAVVAKVEEVEARSFLEEALQCLRVGALRATVVFVWSGAMRVLQERALSSATMDDLNASIEKQDQRARQVRRVDDFAYIRDAVALSAFKDLGLYDKSQLTFLKQALDLRNQCGHPVRYAPQEKKVSAFIEDLVSIVFSTARS